MIWGKLLVFDKSSGNFVILNSGQAQFWSFVQDLFDILDIDEQGLNNIDKKYIQILIEKFNGGPAGLSTMSTSLSEDKQKIEEFIEPYLIRVVFIMKTPKGRTATQLAYKHLGIRNKPSSVQQKMI